MPENYQLALSYAPLFLLALSGSVLFAFRKLTFNANMTILLAAIIAKVILVFMFGGLLFFAVQLLLSIVAFVVLISFFGSKTSGETILTMSSLFALTPLPHGIPAFIAVFVLLLLYSALALRKQKGEWKATIMNAFLSTGLASGMPNYDYLPDKKDLDEKGAKRVSLLPFIAVIYGLFALYYVLRPLLLES